MQRLVALSTLSLGTLLAGCTETTFVSPDLDGPQSNATITVSAPRIFKRETLLNDRMAERTFLDSQLKASETATFSPQLIVDVERIRSVAASLGLSFNPALATDFKRADAVSEKQSELAIATLNAALEKTAKDLELYKKNTTEAPSTFPSTTTTVNTVAGTTPSADTAALVSSLDALISTLRSRLGASSVGPRATTVTAAPREVFQDRQAYRDDLRAAIAANELDDQHDRDGYGLYRLAFDVAVFPGVNPRQYAALSLGIKPKFDEPERRKLYGAWLRHVTRLYNRPVNAATIERRIAIETARGKGLLDIVTISSAEGARFYFAVPAGTRDALARLLDVSERLSELERESARPKETEQRGAANSRAKPTSTATDSASLGAEAGSALEDERQLAPNLNDADAPEQPDTTKTGATSQTKKKQQKTTNEKSINPPDIKNIEINLAKPQETNIKNQDQSANTTQEQIDQKVHLQHESIKKAISNKNAVALSFQDLAASWDLISTSLLGLNEAIARESSSRPPEETKEIQRDLASQLAKVAAMLPPPPKDKATGTGAVPSVFDTTLEKSKHSPIRVYATMPRLLAQQTSMASSVGDALKLAASISASIPGSGLGAQIAGGYDTQTVSRAEALKRLPLLVAFACPPQSDTSSVCAPKAAGTTKGDTGAAATKDTAPPKAAATTKGGTGTVETKDTADAPPMTTFFGWVMGPHASIRPGDSKTTVDLEQPPTPFTLMADLTLPGWWPQVEISAYRAWVGNWRGGTMIGEQPLTPVTFTQRLPLTPADLDALTTYLVADQSLSGPPVIDSVDPAQVSVCNGDTDFLLRGPNLWRSPTVLLGGLTAKKVEVLPDMEGLKATFTLRGVADGIPAPTLSVVTRTGMDSKAISLVGGAACEHPGYVLAQKAEQTISAISPGTIYACDSPVTFIATLSKTGVADPASYQAWIGGRPAWVREVAIREDDAKGNKGKTSTAILKITSLRPIDLRGGSAGELPLTVVIDSKVVLGTTIKVERADAKCVATPKPPVATPKIAVATQPPPIAKPKATVATPKPPVATQKPPVATPTPPAAAPKIAAPDREPRPVGLFVPVKISGLVSPGTAPGDRVVNLCGDSPSFTVTGTNLERVRTATLGDTADSGVQWDSSNGGLMLIFPKFGEVKTATLPLVLKDASSTTVASAAVRVQCRAGGAKAEKG